MSARSKAIAMGRVSAVSIEAGQHLGRLGDSAALKLAAQGEADERCKSCAFRPGTLPNQCADTISDAVKCVVEGSPFHCHVDKYPWGEPAICHGWFAARAVSKGVPDGKVPWAFSHEEEQPTQPEIRHA